MNIADRIRIDIEASRDVHVDASMVEGQARVTLETPNGVYGPVLLALRGEHQIANAVVAVRLLEAAAARGVPVTHAGIEEGLETTVWPARLELITLQGGQRVLLDAAHNADGAQALAAYLREWHPERPALVISVMRDKDVDGILRPLLPRVRAVVTTRAPSHSSSTPSPTAVTTPATSCPIVTGGRLVNSSASMWRSVPQTPASTGVSSTTGSTSRAISTTISLASP